ncbi:MAG: hypothetical protein ACE5R6_06110 [Candidatus Heimdallarchaeota archaeon]
MVARSGWRGGDGAFPALGEKAWPGLVIAQKAANAVDEQECGSPAIELLRVPPWRRVVTLT